MIHAGAQRVIWAANGALGWTALTLLSAADNARRLEFREAARCAAWTPAGFALGATLGLLGLPTLVGPLDIWWTLCNREPRYRSSATW